jgi:hypothetical protein
MLLTWIPPSGPSGCYGSDYAPAGLPQQVQHDYVYPPPAPPFSSPEPSDLCCNSYKNSNTCDNCECGDCAGVSAQSYHHCATLPSVQVTEAARSRILANRNKALEIRRKRFASFPRVDIETTHCQDNLAPVSNLMHASVASGTTEFRRKFKFGNVSADTARHYTKSAPRHFASGC